MKGLIRRAICVAVGPFAFAGAIAAAGGAHAAAPVSLITMAVSGEAISTAADLGQPFALPGASYGPPAASRLAVSNVATSISLITGLDLELGYKVDLTGRFDPFDAGDTHAFDSLFLSSASAGMPYAAAAGGGNFLGAATALAGDLHVNVGVANLAPGFTSYTPDAYTALARVGGETMSYNPRSANSLLAGVTWNFAGFGELGLMAAHTAERDGLLGIASPGIGGSTNALGVSARVHLGNGWVTTASYSEAISQLDLKPGQSPLLGTDELRTRSYGIAIAKNGLFGDDALGLAVSRPALGSDGGAFITMPGGQGQPSFFTRSNMLAGTTPETDVEIGYVTTFLDGALALQANAAYQVNFAGQSGTNAVSLLSRARIKF